MTTCRLNTDTDTVIALHTPWWQRALDAWAERGRRQPQPEAALPHTWRDDDYRALRHLSAGTLRDIGAPGWVHEEEDRSRNRALDLMRL